MLHKVASVVRATRYNLAVMGLLQSLLCLPCAYMSAFARACFVRVEFCSDAGRVHLRWLAYCALNAVSAALVDVDCILMSLSAVHCL